MKKLLKLIPILALALAMTSRADAHGHINAGAIDSNGSGKIDAGDRLNMYYEHGTNQTTLSFNGGLGDYGADGFVWNGYTTLTSLHQSSDASEAPNYDPLGALSGSFIKVKLVSLSGTPGAKLAFYDSHGTEPLWVYQIGTGFLVGDGSIELTESDWFDFTPSDPFGHIHGRMFGLDQTGTFTATWVLTDTEKATTGLVDSLPFTSTFAASTFSDLGHFDRATTGSGPGSDLIEGSDGNLYGTTPYGGDFDAGTLFQLTPDGELSTLASFGSPGIGTHPVGRLLQAADGSFYGVTSLAADGVRPGSIFKYTPGTGLATVATFNTSNGANPAAGLIKGIDGNYYGTTEKGGTNGSGTVYKLTPAGALSTVASFDASATGTFPRSVLLQDSNGDFYGTTVLGGKYGQGTIFKLKGSTITTVYAFGARRGTTGQQPVAGLIKGSDGSFYGTTFKGGESDHGTVFKFNSRGLTTLVSFDDIDDGYPIGGVVEGKDGFLYGTVSGYTTYAGSVFQLSPVTLELKTLVAFEGDNGNYPLSGLVQASDSRLYGTTSQGGNEAGDGVAFAITSTDPLVQTIAFPQVTGAKAGQSATLAATASSGLPVAYTVVSGPATIAGNVVTFTGVGTVKIAADQAGDGSYLPATQAISTIKVAKGTQTLSAWTEIGPKTFPSADFTLSPPTASSGLTVQVTVISGPAKIVGNTVKLTGTGRVVLRANQAGNSSYHATPSLNTAFTVKAN